MMVHAGSNGRMHPQKKGLSGPGDVLAIQLRRDFDVFARNSAGLVGGLLQIERVSLGAAPALARWEAGLETVLPSLVAQTEL
jgi:hypothetical protein